MSNLARGRREGDYTRIAIGEYFHLYETTEIHRPRDRPTDDRHKELPLFLTLTCTLPSEKQPRRQR